MLIDMIELAIGQKFSVTMNGKLMHGIVKVDESHCCCDGCMFVEKMEICKKMRCSSVRRKDGKLVHYEEVRR